MTHPVLPLDLPDHEIDDLIAKYWNSRSNFLTLRRCSVCQYQIGYVLVNRSLYLDRSCLCTRYRSIPLPMLWRDFTPPEVPKLA